MEVKKINNYAEIVFGNQRFVFDPPTLQEPPPLILSDFSLKVNRDKIFNSPGEYNIGNVYFYGFSDRNYISYLFQNEEGTLLYGIQELSEETLKKLKLMKVELDVLFVPSGPTEKILSSLKPKIILTYKDINLPKFSKEKTNKTKINLKKVRNLIFVLQ